MPKHLHEEHTNIPRVFTDGDSPKAKPDRIGDIHVDTVKKEVYLSVGTSSISDWTQLL